MFIVPGSAGSSVLHSEKIQHARSVDTSIREEIQKVKKSVFAFVLKKAATKVPDCGN